MSYKPKDLPELTQKKNQGSTKLKVEIHHGLRTNEVYLIDSTKVESHSLAVLIMISVRSLRSKDLQSLAEMIKKWKKIIDQLWVTISQEPKRNQRKSRYRVEAHHFYFLNT